MTRRFDYEFEEDPRFDEPSPEELALYRRRQELEPDLLHLADQMIMAYMMLQPRAIEPEKDWRPHVTDTQEWKELSTEPKFPLRFTKGRDILSGIVVGGVIKARLSNGHELTFIHNEKSVVWRWQFTRSRIIAPEQMEMITLTQHNEPRPHPDNTKMSIEVETRQHDEDEPVWGDTIGVKLLCGSSDYYDGAEKYIDDLHQDTQRALDEFIS